MTFNFEDAWILYSIFCSEISEQGATLKHIISYADYSNHAIITYPELTKSLKKLLSAGLVIQLDKKFATTDSYKIWWDAKFKERKRIYILKAIEDTEKFLYHYGKSCDLLTFHVTLKITEEEFSKAVNAYIEESASIIKKSIGNSI